MPAFVTFEGIDGSGKSSVLARVAELLRAEGIRVWVTKEPSGGWLGRLVKESHRDASYPEVEALLFVADRAEHQKEIDDHLRAGEHVLCDRYTDSTRAYQRVILAPRLPGAARWLEGLHPPFVRRPDLTLLLDVRPEIGLARIAGRPTREKFEQRGFLRKVRAAYLGIARRDRRRVRVVDAGRSLEECAARCLELVRGSLGGRPRRRRRSRATG